jgi:hypothetical protein
MNAPADVFSFRIEPGELDVQAIVEVIKRVIVGLPALTALPAAVSPSFWITTGTQAADMIRSLTNIPLADVLVAGWNQHARFAKYTNPAEFPPEKENRVPLATHHITSSYKPKLELLVDGRPEGSIPLELDLDLALEGVDLFIQAGRFTRVAGGRARLTGTLKFADKTVWERATRDLLWPVGFPLGDKGIAIATVA